MQELELLGYSVLLTARDCFQVCDLADLFHLNYRRIGRHYGRHKVLKAWGTIVRALQLYPIARRERPDIAVSHGSRSQLLAATALKIPSVVILDYEFVQRLPGVAPTWVMTPEVIPHASVRFPADKVLQYPGIKEDVYVPRFRPDPSLRARLGISADELVVTVRPPADEAHYHNPESEQLLEAVIEVLGSRPDTRIVMLPRNARQAASIRKAWPDLLAKGTMIIPDQVFDGLNIIWHSDLVVSGGGTMNREAAAMGIPVYSIFRGQIGAVDRYLAANGRLILLESTEDVRAKLVVKRRSHSASSQIGTQGALQSIVTHIVSAVESGCRIQEKATA